MAAFNLRQILLLWRLWNRIKSRQKRQTLWFLRKPSIDRRGELGEFKLVQKLYFNDHETFFKYFRMSPINFNYLLSLVSYKIQRKASSRGYVSARVKVAITLSSRPNNVNLMFKCCSNCVKEMIKIFAALMFS